MTVRDSVEGPRRIVPRDQWGFARDDGGVDADPTRVYMAAKFEPNKIYEVVYTAENPPIVGLGPAAIRDVDLDAEVQVGRARCRFPPARSGARRLRHLAERAVPAHISVLRLQPQTRTNRKVFDGVIAHVAGAGRGSFNHRFAQPSRDGHPYINFFYPTDIFPFTDVAQKDPETGVTDGLLTHAGSPELLPKIFYTNSEYEYWGRAASLIHTTVDGTADAPLMDNVRIYLLSAGQHGPARSRRRRRSGSSGTTRSITGGR